jgi:hypothetical protein
MPALKERRQTIGAYLISIYRQLGGKPPEQSNKEKDVNQIMEKISQQNPVTVDKPPNSN